MLSEALVIFVLHIDKLGMMFAIIFKSAFGIKAVGGGVTGIGNKP